MKKTFWILALALLVFSIAVLIPGTNEVHSQGRGAITPETLARRNALEKELQSIAIVERKLMIPMRDGKRMATDVYRPKDTSKKYPDDLRPHALQLQFLGRPQRRAARYDKRTRGGQARLRLRRDERARSTFSPKETTTFLARRSPTATTSSRGSPNSHGRTARSARSDAPRPPNGSWRSRRRVILRSRP